ncbi:hypothetical protein PAPYR_3638 [Paratrimastix pyriformis]|uniref:Histidine kinase domain-containing protein n=1 Tax=Paratrimastix pyriformis TaxID=342808 RepID=A0ABQ8UQD1_9EUKA|nr:hypothetical protein PAPYR_3638 [Paratrimastix pyriformis]
MMILRKRPPTASCFDDIEEVLLGGLPERVMEKRNKHRESLPRSCLVDIPTKILRNVVRVSPSPIRTYSLLLGLCHTIRRDLPPKMHLLDFDDPQPESDFGRCPSSVAISALAGPCRRLRELRFHPVRALTGCGREESSYGPWVRRAFDGHTKLSTLHIPTMAGLSDGALMAIITLVSPHIEELHIGTGATPGSVPLSSLYVRTILDAISRCPRLRTLRLHLDESMWPDYSPLRACQGLRCLVLSNDAADTVGDLLPCLPQLVWFARQRSAYHPLQLELRVPAIPCALPSPGLVTALEVTHPTFNFLPALCAPGSGFDHLADLALSVHSLTSAIKVPPFAAILALNAASLRTVRLAGVDIAAMPALVDALARLPLLQTVELTGGGEWTHIPPMDALLTRVQRLALDLPTDYAATEPEWLLRCGSALRELRLPWAVSCDQEQTITVDASGLRVLVLPQLVGNHTSQRVLLRCPALERMTISPWADLKMLCPTPWLTALSGCADPRALIGHCPALGHLEDVHVATWPALVGLLRGSIFGQLQLARGMVANLPAPESMEGLAPGGDEGYYLLPVSASLRSLDLNLTGHSASDLPTVVIEASALQSLSLRSCRIRDQLTLLCPCLEQFRLTVRGHAQPCASLPPLRVSLSPTAPLRHLTIESDRPVDLGDIGELLLSLVPSLWSLRLSVPHLDWGTIAPMVHSLQHIQLLELHLAGPASVTELELRSPTLIKLTIHGAQLLRRLTVDCPLLEEFSTDHGQQRPTPSPVSPVVDRNKKERFPLGFVDKPPSWLGVLLGSIQIQSRKLFNWAVILAIVTAGLCALPPLTLLVFGHDFPQPIQSTAANLVRVSSERLETLTRDSFHKRFELRFPLSTNSSDLISSGDLTFLCGDNPLNAPSASFSGVLYFRGTENFFIGCDSSALYSAVISPDLQPPVEWTRQEILSSWTLGPISQESRMTDALPLPLSSFPPEEGEIHVNSSEQTDLVIATWKRLPWNVNSDVAGMTLEGVRLSDWSLLFPYDDSERDTFFALLDDGLRVLASDRPGGAADLEPILARSSLRPPLELAANTSLYLGVDGSHLYSLQPFQVGSRQLAVVVGLPLDTIRPTIARMRTGMIYTALGTFFGGLAVMVLSVCIIQRALGKLPALARQSLPALACWGGAAAAPPPSGQLWLQKLAAPWQQQQQQQPAEGIWWLKEPAMTLKAIRQPALAQAALRSVMESMPFPVLQLEPASAHPLAACRPGADIRGWRITGANKAFCERFECGPNELPALCDFLPASADPGSRLVLHTTGGDPVRVVHHVVPVAPRVRLLALPDVTAVSAQLSLRAGASRCAIQAGLRHQMAAALTAGLRRPLAALAAQLPASECGCPEVAHFRALLEQATAAAAKLMDLFAAAGSTPSSSTSSLETPTSRSTSTSTTTGGPHSTCTSRGPLLPLPAPDFESSSLSAASSRQLPPPPRPSPATSEAPSAYLCLAGPALLGSQEEGDVGDEAQEALSISLMCPSGPPLAQEPLPAPQPQPHPAGARPLRPLLSIAINDDELVAIPHSVATTATTLVVPATANTAIPTPHSLRTPHSTHTTTPHSIPAVGLPPTEGSRLAGFGFDDPAVSGDAPIEGSSRPLGDLSVMGRASPPAAQSAPPAPGLPRIDSFGLPDFPSAPPRPTRAARLGWVRPLRMLGPLCARVASKAARTAASKLQPPTAAPDAAMEAVAKCPLAGCCCQARLRLSVWGLGLLCIVAASAGTGLSIPGNGRRMTLSYVETTATLAGAQAQTDLLRALEASFVVTGRIADAYRTTDLAAVMEPDIGSQLLTQPFGSLDLLVSVVGPDSIVDATALLAMGRYVSCNFSSALCLSRQMLNAKAVGPCHVSRRLHPPPKVAIPEPIRQGLRMCQLLPCELPDPARCPPAQLKCCQPATTTDGRLAVVTSVFNTAQLGPELGWIYARNLTVAGGLEPLVPTRRLAPELLAQVVDLLAAAPPDDHHPDRLHLLLPANASAGAAAYTVRAIEWNGVALVQVAAAQADMAPFREVLASSRASVWGTTLAVGLVACGLCHLFAAILLRPFAALPRRVESLIRKELERPLAVPAAKAAALIAAEPPDLAAERAASRSLFRDVRLTLEAVRAVRTEPALLQALVDAIPFPAAIYGASRAACWGDLDALAAAMGGPSAVQPRHRNGAFDAAYGTHVLLSAPAAPLDPAHRAASTPGKAPHQVVVHVGALAAEGLCLVVLEDLAALLEDEPADPPRPRVLELPPPACARVGEALRATNAILTGLLAQLSPPCGAAAREAGWVPLPPEWAPLVRRAADTVDKASLALRQAHGPGAGAAPLDVHQYIGMLADHLRALFEPARVQVRQALGARRHILPRGDPAQLVSALLEVALNGRDAMAPRGGVLLIGTANATSAPPAAAACLVVTVTDSGTGIPTEVQPHLFEPFTTKPEATGLGLAAVHGALGELNGWADVATGPWGTAVSLWLPLDGRPGLAPAHRVVLRSCDDGAAPADLDATEASLWEACSVGPSDWNPSARSLAEAALPPSPPSPHPAASFHPPATSARAAPAASARPTCDDTTLTTSGDTTASTYANSSLTSVPTADASGSLAEDDTASCPAVAPPPRPARQWDRRPVVPTLRLAGLFAGALPSQPSLPSCPLPSPVTAAAPGAGPGYPPAARFSLSCLYFVLLSSISCYCSFPSFFAFLSALLCSALVWVRHCIVSAPRGFSGVLVAPATRFSPSFASV